MSDIDIEKTIKALDKEPWSRKTKLLGLIYHHDPSLRRAVMCELGKCSLSFETLIEYTYVSFPDIREWALMLITDRLLHDHENITTKQLTRLLKHHDDYVSYFAKQLLEKRFNKESIKGLMSEFQVANEKTQHLILEILKDKLIKSAL